MILFYCYDAYCGWCYGFSPVIKEIEEEFKEKAQYEFALCSQLQVTGFPALLLQASESKFYLVSRGYATQEDVKKRIENILKEWEAGIAG